MALAGLALSVTAQAQSNWSKVPVPVYNPTHFVQGVYRHQVAPQANEFARRSAELTPAVQALCDAAPRDAAVRLGAARAGWRASVVAWDRLAAVAIGPVVERRSQRQIDFSPTRPALIAKAIDAAPADATAMERVGTPAKGLPALEWLLWKQPPAPNSAACAYTVQVAADIAREADALQAAYRLSADSPWDDEPAAVAAMSEIVNQWVGGVERLRWAQLDKPLKSAGSAPPAYPRGDAGASAASWAAQWQSLRSLAVLDAGAAPVPGEALVPLESYLRGKGRNGVADALVRASAQVDVAFKALAAGSARAPNASRVMAASAALAALKRVAEVDLAPALQVSIGFSDADGD